MLCVLEELLHVYPIVVFGEFDIKNVAAIKTAVPNIQANLFNIFYLVTNYKCSTLDYSGLMLYN